MAYFLTFILAPLQDVLIQRPLICASAVYCGHPCVRPGKGEKMNLCGKKESWFEPGTKVARYETQAERWANQTTVLEDGQWDPTHDVMNWEVDESICCYAVPPKQFSSVKSAGGHPIKNCLWELFALAKIPDVLSVVMTFIMASAILVSTVTVVATEIFEVIEDASFQDRYRNAVDDVNRYLKDEWDISVAELKNLSSDVTTEVTTDDLSTVFTPYLLALNDIVFTLLLCMYMLATRRPESEEEAFKDLETMSMVEKITAKIKHYVVLKTALSFLTGVLTGLFLWITGVRLFFLFALLTFILNFIPNVGSLMAMLLPIPIILLDEVPDDRFPGPDILRQMLAFSLPAIVQMYVGNVLEPAVFGESLNVTAISVLVALVLWGSIWGIQGAILSVPLLAAFKIGLEEADYPLAKLVLRMIRETSSVDDMVLMNHTRAERRAHREKLGQSMTSNRTKLKAEVSKINNPMISSPTAGEVPG
jgi:predicted PurR-regulated permease PerM